MGDRDRRDQQLQGQGRGQQAMGGVEDIAGYGLGSGYTGDDYSSSGTAGSGEAFKGLCGSGTTGGFDSGGFGSGQQQQMRPGDTDMSGLMGVGGRTVEEAIDSGGFGGGLMGTEGGDMKGIGGRSENINIQGKRDEEGMQHGHGHGHGHGGGRGFGASGEYGR